MNMLNLRLDQLNNIIDDSLIISLLKGKGKNNSIFVVVNFAPVVIGWLLAWVNMIFEKEVQL